LATRTVARGELVLQEEPLAIIQTDPAAQMRDAEIRPLLMRCLAAGGGTRGRLAGGGGHPEEVRELMARVTEINARRAYEALPPSARSEWMALLDAFALAPGGAATIVGLSSPAGSSMNELRVTVLRFDWERDRWRVRLPDAREVSVRPQNLDAAMRSKTAGGVFRTNSYGFDGGRFAGLYALLSRMNHACEPNVRKEFAPGGRMSVYTTKPVAAGAQFFSCYGGNELPVQQRREHLQHKYKFWCECQRCVREQVEQTAAQA
jgi:hypothetical protein